MSSFPILSAIWLTPFLAGLGLIVLVPGQNVKAVKVTALLASGLSLLLTAFLCFRFDYARGGELQFKELFPLITDLRVNYSLGASIGKYLKKSSVRVAGSRQHTGVAMGISIIIWMLL